MLFMRALKMVHRFVEAKCNRLEFEKPIAFAETVCRAISREVSLPANEEVKIRRSVDRVGRDVIRLTGNCLDEEFTLDWDGDLFRGEEWISIRYLVLGGCEFSLGAYYAALISQESERNLLSIGGPKYYLGNRFEKVVFIDGPEDD